MQQASFKETMWRIRNAIVAQRGIFFRNRGWVLQGGI